MPESLYKRIIEQGTLDEPKGKPNPVFALPSTRNWMRALAISSNEITWQIAKSNYVKVQRRTMSPQNENTVLEQLFLSLHHLSALSKMKSDSDIVDFSRISVVAWYYGISNAARAMIAAQQGSCPEDHSGTARVWDEIIASKNLSIFPFNLRVDTLVEKEFKQQITALRNGCPADLLKEPISDKEALGALTSYLSGTADWYSWLAKERVKVKPEFRELGVENFRSKAAQKIRDTFLGSKSVGFLHEAHRYRGKANYREALFLAYGQLPAKVLVGFQSDLQKVLGAFLTMSGALCSQRLGKSTWNEFISDIETNKAFTMSAKNILIK
ncbi:hypothetical protein [Thalassospira sp.]|uniref:hypothetical protein n=1 Tax=Thalassospira sp. TaxID=1912094 RepID=UPI00262C31B1|nr:hypothetical protein [Thalassospira sp.]MCH2275500.1 hypothetical protein [Thalassospira sp.]